MDEDVSTILFLCSADEQQLKSIEDVFNAEADKMELVWRAKARNIADISGATQFDDVRRIIVLVESTQKATYAEVLARNAAKIDVWEMDSIADAHAFVQRELKSLVVRLILAGGKRKPAEQGKQTICSQCKKSGLYCVCVPSKNTGQSKKAAAAVVRVMLERKGRKGKDVTVLSGFDEAQNLDELAARFKKLCGTGGTIKDGQIEIQGDHRLKLIAELEAKGFKCKRVGG